MTEKELKTLLLDAWKLFAECYVEGTQPDDIKRKRAFVALDRKLRAAGILPAVK